MTDQPRSEDEPQEETLDFTKPDYQFIPKGNHEWRQRGPYLVCVSCELQHAVYIGMEKRLVGFDQGRPIIKKID